MLSTTCREARVIALTLFTLCFGLCHFTNAQPKSEVLDRWKAEDARIARLAALGRLWGTVKFFHPYLAYKEIDWDKALIETIPRVNAAKSSEEYNAAINHLLSFLNDPNTRSEIIDEPKASAAVEKSGRENLVRLVEGVLIVDALAIAEVVTQDAAALNQFRTKVVASLPQAKAIVLNCRAKSELSETGLFYFDFFTRQMLQQILDSSVKLGSSRYRMQSGYPPQLGVSSGGYYAGFISTTPLTIEGRNKSKSPPMVVLINDKTPSAGEIISGLQATGRVLVVQEGDAAREMGIGSFQMQLPDKVQVQMRTTELINPDGSVGFRADATVAKDDQRDLALAAALNAISQNTFNRSASRTSNVVPARSAKDNSYPEMEFPGVEYRLLGLFRLWNIINYFFPYKHLIDEPWADILPRYIPKLEANKDALEYQTTIHELAAEIDDSHVGVSRATKFAEKLGSFVLPMRLGYMENQTVVTKVHDEKSGVKVGDVILSIGGEPIERRRSNLARLFAASTPQASAVRLNFLLLLGSKDKQVELTVRGVDGKNRVVQLSHSISASDPRLYQPTETATTVVQILPSKFAYVDLRRLQVGEVDQMFETIKVAPATIFDMRGYPNTTAWEIAPRLTERKSIVAAVASRPMVEAASLSDKELVSPSYFFGQKLLERKGVIYKGKVVMLINEEAISRAEHACLFFESATDVTFVGTPTAGANGDVTTMVLPGNLVVSFSGHDIRHADGRQLQRLGIQPHVRSEPTIKGMLAGRDEVLEAAVKYLQEKLKK